MALQEEFESQGNYLFKKRSNLPIIIMFVALIVHAMNARTGDYEFPAFFPSIYEWICIAVSLAGLIVRIYTVGYTPKNTSGRNTDEGQLADTLNTKGIYSTVRHPLYVGNFLMWLGIGMLTGELWFIVAFVFIYWVYYERIMFAEEQFLRRKFGDVYLQWAEKTPAFTPRFSQFSSADLKFSWKKVLKKEKNGLFAMFLVFFLFKLAGRSFDNLDFHLKLDFWFYAAVVTGVIYFILKFLKRGTSVLDEEGR